MTRGFMYAGAARVVASLWQVDDVATAELMSLFYQGILKKNLPPAAALRAAQVQMWKQKRWQARPLFLGRISAAGGMEVTRPGAFPIAHMLESEAKLFGF